MNVSTITVEREEALTKLAEYRRLNRRQVQPEDTRLRQLYQAVAKGSRVVNVLEAFKATGLNTDGHPKLAIARADWRNVFFRCGSSQGRGRFAENATWRQYVADIALPDGTFQFPNTQPWSTIKSAVPHIPPAIRPKIALSNFHILFEVEKWETYPVDPFLLRHISGYLYIVIAEWELTELEASLLGSMRSGI